MYLPDTIQDARILITVKTYPTPSTKYEELVCTAGVLPSGEWVRIYPVPFRGLPYAQQYKKFDWIKLDLIRNFKDFRQESYKPKWDKAEAIQVLDSLSTGKDKNWGARKDILCKNTYTSMTQLVTEARAVGKKSLATFKPTKIIDFIVEKDKSEWKPEIKAAFHQLKLFESDLNPSNGKKQILRKLPYKYYYRFRSEDAEHKMMIEDWEIGALYWNCLQKSEGDEMLANQLVRQKYFDEFLKEKDLFFFLGTTKLHHNVSLNPFFIIGVFYPPKSNQLTLF